MSDMPGINRNSRVVRIIESSLDRLESETTTTTSAADALLALDELRRLERKWREQVAAGSSRRTDADFLTLKGWYRRWLLAAKRLSAQPGDLADRLREACAQVERSL